ncbi:UNVERIFIED_CONTAM: hypothetical protein HDU68_007968, partial [Siphonaria sp. JEL0065]
MNCNDDLEAAGVILSLGHTQIDEVHSECDGDIVGEAGGTVGAYDGHGSGLIPGAHGNAVAQAAAQEGLRMAACGLSGAAVGRGTDLGGGSAQIGVNAGLSSLSTRPHPCEGCRAWRRKCDTTKPSCARCLERGIPCVYVRKTPLGDSSSPTISLDSSSTNLDGCAPAAGTSSSSTLAANGVSLALEHRKYHRAKITRA